MKVLNPTQINHNITFVPRFLSIENIILSLKNEVTKENISIPISFSYNNGLCVANFTYTFIDKANYQIKFLQKNEIIYRGKLFITTQI